ncbi:MAG: hypothetical protein EOR60_26360 [Mesorhizobium sp.]|nr:MAG: hypothetical protein EOR60_26360 [Mesorhizobium sp.]
MSDHSIHFEPRARQSEADIAHVKRSIASIRRSKQVLAGSKPVNPHNLSSAITRTAVSITGVCGEWHVMVEELGCSAIVRSFPYEHTALIFAHANRKRLGLDKVERI